MCVVYDVTQSVALIWYLPWDKAGGVQQKWHIIQGII